MMTGLVTHEQIETLCAIAERLATRGQEDESRALCEVLAQLQRAPREVSAAAAAKILAVPPQTIRNGVRGGILPRRWDRTGHFYVSLDALESVLRLRQISPDVPASTITDKEIDAEIEAVRAERRTWAVGGR